MATVSDPKNVSSVKSLDAFTGWLLTNTSELHVALFFATWHEPSCPGGQLDTVIRTLAELHSNVLFAKVDAEECSDVAEQLEVTVVPTIVFLKGKAHSQVDRLEGVDVPALTSRVDKWKSAAPPETPSAVAAVQRTMEELDARVEKLTHAAHVMLFMKGSPDAPKCKFSRKVVEQLRARGVTFGSFDILTSDAVRQRLKTLSDWNTYPQVYVAGTLVGGCDILQELADSGEWESVFPPAAQLQPVATAAGGPSLTPAALPAPAASAAAPAVAPELSEATRARLTALTSRSPVMLFMKGNAREPACGFSAQMVTMLNTHKIAFDDYDILTDAEARAGLKIMFNWNTFPQLYVRGVLQGGLDVLRQMLEDDPTTPLAVQLGL